MVADPTDRAHGAEFNTDTAITAAALTENGTASRSSSRTPLATNSGTMVSINESSEWSIGGSSEINPQQLTRQAADNPQVAKLITSRDHKALPVGFNPNHAIEDTGNAYPFSQCTWWAYIRRHQLGLPVGSYYGNGADWANSAKQLGYWVDNTPRVGDIMVFQRGQEGASAFYGHVAIVEAVNPDGSVTTSECGASYNGKPFTRTFSNVGDFQYIHY